MIYSNKASVIVIVGSEVLHFPCSSRFLFQNIIYIARTVQPIYVNFAFLFIKSKPLVVKY